MFKHHPATPAGRRYLARFAPLMVAYVVVLFGTIYVIKHFAPTGLLLWLLGLAPALPILGCIAAMGQFIREETDEVPRAILIEAMLWGIGATLSLFTVWGFLENAGAIGALPAWIAFPAFCGFMGMAQVLVSRRYR